MSGAQEDPRGKIFQELRFLDERISAEEIDLLEKKQAMTELLKGSGEARLLLGAGLPGCQQLSLEAPQRRVVSF